MYERKVYVVEGRRRIRPQLWRVNQAYYSKPMANEALRKYRANNPKYTFRIVTYKPVPSTR